MKIRIIEIGEERFYEFRDHESIITIGRTKDCDIQLAEKRCSRKHCQIRRTENGFVIKDLDSSNGTIVNGTKCKEVKLNLGDKIEIGKAVIFFGEPRPAKKIPVPSNFVQAANIPNLSKAARNAERINAEKANKQFNLVKSFAITVLVLFVLGIIGAFIYKDYIDKTTDADSAKDESISDTDRVTISDVEAKQKKALEDEFEKIKNMDIDIEKKLIMLNNYVNSLQNTETGKKYYLEFFKRKQFFEENLHIWVSRKLYELSSTANKYIQERKFSEIIQLYSNFIDKYSHRYYKPDEWMPELSDKMTDVILAAELFFDAEIVREANVYVAQQDWESAKKVYDNARETYFKDIRSLYIACNEKMEMLDRVLDVIRSGQYEVPEDLIERITKPREPEPKPVRPIEPSDEPEPEPETISDEDLIDLLNTHLIKSINKKDNQRLTSDIIFFEPGNSRSRKPISKADSEYLYYRDRGEQSIAWSDLSPEIMLDLYWKIRSKTPESYLGMSAYAYSEDMRIEASEILAEFYVKNKDLKKQIDKFMSRHIGREVPKNGFLYHKVSNGRDRLITPEEFQRFENQKKLERMLTQLRSAARKLERARSDRAIELAKNEIKEILLNMLKLDPEEEVGEAISILRDSMRNMAQKANTGGGHLTPALKSKLDNARNKALSRIEDKVRYPDANHGIRDANGEHGQPWVDDAVNELRDTWKDPAYGQIEVILTKLVEMFHEFINLIDPEAKYHDPDKDKDFIEEAKKQLEDNQIMRDNNAATTEHCTANEKAHVAIVNEYRVMLGRRPLRINPKLTLSSRKHSEYMKQTNQFAHVVPGHPDGAEPQQRAKKYGYNAGVGENIAMNSAGHTPMSSFVAWYNSSGHHRNMVNRNWRVMGVGDAGSHWCQMFGGTEDGSEPREASKSR